MFKTLKYYSSKSPDSDRVEASSPVTKLRRLSLHKKLYNIILLITRLIDLCADRLFRFWSLVSRAQEKLGLSNTPITHIFC